MSSQADPAIKCVLFDIGGVVVGSPLAAINVYEQNRNLPRHWINVAITSQGAEGAFQRFERNELDLHSFYRQFGTELSNAEKNNQYYRDFCQVRAQPIPSNLPTSLQVDGRELFGFMMRESFKADPKMLKAIVTLRQSGRFKVAALTNNFTPPTTVPSTSDSDGKPAPTLEEEVEHLGLGPAYEQLKSCFDLFIESAKVGMRKPDPEFFRYALRALDVQAQEVVFLDDIGINLKAAKTLGMKTIRVSIASSIPALQELEKVVGMRLIEDDDLQEYEAKVARRRKARDNKL
ncbi:hypothetical protein V8E36_005758 [Tilletia maclaganii]